MLLAGVVLGSAPGDVGAGSVTAAEGHVAELTSTTVATVAVVGRAKGWGEAELAWGDHTSRSPLWVVVTGGGLLPVVGGLWWLSRPDRRVGSSQPIALLAASRAPPPAV